MSAPEPSSPPHTSKTYPHPRANYHNYSKRIYKSPQHPERPYTDLRDLLNDKRQHQPKSNLGGPPADPKHNFLSDPTRDNISPDNHNHGNNARFVPTTQQANFNRSSSFNNSGRGRGRGFRTFLSEDAKVGPSRGDQPHDNNWNVDHNRPYRDHGRDDQHHHRRQHYENNSSYREDGPARSNSFRKSNTEHPNYPVETVRSPVHHQSRPSGSKQETGNYYRGRGQQQQHQQQYNRGGRGQSYNYHRKNFTKNPVNITVEYSVEDGTRKCTAQKVQLGKSAKSNNYHRKRFTKPKKEQSEKTDDASQEQSNEPEENWDDAPETNVEDNAAAVVGSSKEEKHLDEPEHTPPGEEEVEEKEETAAEKEIVGNDKKDAVEVEETLEQIEASEEKLEKTGKVSEGKNDKTNTEEDK